MRTLSQPHEFQDANALDLVIFGLDIQKLRLTSTSY